MPSTKAKSNGKVKSARLTLEDFSDRELLWGLEAATDDDGTCTSREMAQELGLPNLEHAHRNIAIRLGWQRRYGIVDRNDEGRWHLTEVGKQLLHGHLKTNERRLLDELGEMKLLTVMDRIGKRMQMAGPEAATMAQRDWRHAVAARKRAH